MQTRTDLLNFWAYTALTVGFYSLINLFISNAFISILVAMTLSTSFLVVVFDTYKVYKVRRALKKLNFNSIEAFLQNQQQQRDFIVKIQSLPDDQKLEISQKSAELLEDIKKLNSQKDLYFTMKNTTRENEIKKREDEWKSWMKDRGYPIPEQPTTKKSQ